MKKVKIISLSLLLIILCLFVSCGGSDVDSNNSAESSTQTETKTSQKETEETIAYNKEKIEATIFGYCEAMDTQNYEQFKKYRPSFSDELKSTLFDTVLKSKVIEIEFDKLEEIDENSIKVPVKYTITYSKDAIPAGSRKIGKNRIHENFTLVDKGDYYIITKLIDPNVDF